MFESRTAHHFKTPPQQLCYIHNWKVWKIISQVPDSCRRHDSATSPLVRSHQLFPAQDGTAVSGELLHRVLFHTMMRFERQRSQGLGSRGCLSRYPTSHFVQRSSLFVNMKCDGACNPMGIKGLWQRLLAIKLHRYSGCSVFCWSSYIRARRRIVRCRTKPKQTVLIR